MKPNFYATSNAAYLYSDDLLRHTFNQAVDELLLITNKFPAFKSASDDQSWSKTHPRVNVHRDKEKNTLVVDFVVPYYKKGDLTLEIDDTRRLIKLSGNNVNENIPDSSYVARSVSKGSFTKELVLEQNEPYDLNKVKAVHENGVLRLTIDSLKPKVTHRKVEID
jgi:HSP20 family molecular chaperone IbpA